MSTQLRAALRPRVEIAEKRVTGGQKRLRRVRRFNQDPYCTNTNDEQTGSPTQPCPAKPIPAPRLGDATKANHTAGRTQRL